MTNPFKPSAGTTPPLLVGRDAAIAEYDESLDDGPGAPMRLARITGARGVGKTVMLTAVGDSAKSRGWIVIAETATTGMMSRLTTAVQREASRDNGKKRRKVQSVELPSVLGTGGGGITLTEDLASPGGFREAAGALLDRLEAGNTGLLITVDEVHNSAIAEMRELATVYQHLVREGRNVGLAMAGLPSSISDLLNDDVLTFLRRAVPVELTDIPLSDVEFALKSTVEETGRTIAPDALAVATTATGGFPFMIQLVGYHIWRQATSQHIDLAAANRGIDAARVRLGSTVHQTALADLSKVDRTYLLAMARDNGPSSTGDVAQRMGRPISYASVYRSRLIQAGIIVVTGHGQVDFAIPFLRDYLREHAAVIEMTSRSATP